MLWKSPLRTLLAVYSLVLVAGACELRSKLRGPQHFPDVYGDPFHNLPEAMWRMYPDSADAEYLIGLRFDARASGRSLQGDPGQMSQAMSEFQEAARHYERAIALGLKSEEKLYYNYAVTLIRIHASPARIERAIDEWHRYFPYSTFQDLRQTPPDN